MSEGGQYNLRIMKRQVAVFTLEQVEQSTKDELLESAKAVKSRENEPDPFLIMRGHIAIAFKDAPDFLEVLRERQLFLRF